MAKKSIILKCQHDKTEIRKMNSLRFNVCLNCGHKELIDEIKIPVIKTLPKEVVHEKKPKSGSMLQVILEKFPSDKELSMDEILVLVRKGNADMQAKKDSSLKTVVKELVIGSKASPHINRYSFLKFDESTKKYQRA